MKIKIFMIPKNHEYIRRLKYSLEKINIKIVILKPFHYSSFTNVIKILLFRLLGYKIIHVHWLYIFPYKFIMRFFYFFCKILDIKIIWEIHNIIPHNYKEVDKKNSKWFFEKADAIIFHSENDILRCREILMTKKNKINIVIHHGNFNGSYENKITKKEARKILGIPEWKRVILCFGFIRKNRGYEYLIEATKNMDEYIVIIAGKIEDKEVYERLLKYKKNSTNLMIFGKWIPDREIQIYFNACDVVVLPYIQITTSGVIPLAYAFSRPVITSDIGGLREVVKENIGILIPPADVYALKNAIKKIFEMNLEEMGKAAFEYAENELNWKSNAEKIKDLYIKLLYNIKST